MKRTTLDHSQGKTVKGSWQGTSCNGTSSLSRENSNETDGLVDLSRGQSCWRPRTFPFSGQSAGEKGVLHTEKNSVVSLETSSLVFDL